MTDLVLSALHIYPIKSASGRSQQAAQLTPRGFVNDRRYMVVDAAGQFMTQRRFPKMALIQVDIKDNQIGVSAPGMSALELPAMRTSMGLVQDNRNDEMTVEVWGDRTQALSLGSDAQAWFTQFLGTPCQLVYMPEESHRPTDHGKLGADTIVSFADAYPYLLISEASLTELNNKLNAKKIAPVGMNRFRPNLVVRGDMAPHAEDQWQRIRIGEAIFSVAKPCARCSVPTVDQSTGEKSAGNEPIKTLATYRMWDKAIWFGQNLIQENPAVTATLQVGDRIEVLS